MAQHAARLFAGIQAQGAQTLRGWTPWHPSGTVGILHPPDRKTSIELLLTDGISRWALRPTQADAGFIASYKKPRRVEFVDMLPRTESGEVDREQVIATYA